MTATLKRLCPLCKKELYYSSTSSLNYAIRKNQKCLSCSRKGRPSANRKRPFESLYNQIKYTSKNREIENSLAFEEFIDFTKIDKCYYCGNKIKWNEYNSYDNNHRIHSSYNLDRKDNNDGYKKDNCVVCCELCNYMKRMMTIEQFIQHCRDIVNHQQKVVNIT